MISFFYSYLFLFFSNIVTPIIIKTTPKIHVGLTYPPFHRSIQPAWETKISIVVVVTPFKLYELNLNLKSPLLANKKNTKPRPTIKKWFFYKSKKYDPIIVAKKAHIPAKTGCIRFLTLSIWTFIFLLSRYYLF